jgi:hypothetical protein
MQVLVVILLEPDLTTDSRSGLPVHRVAQGYQKVPSVIGTLIQDKNQQ